MGGGLWLGVSSGCISLAGSVETINSWRFWPSCSALCFLVGFVCAILPFPFFPFQSFPFCSCPSHHCSHQSGGLSISGWAISLSVISAFLSSLLSGYTSIFFPFLSGSFLPKLSSSFFLLFLVFPYWVSYFLVFYRILSSFSSCAICYLRFWFSFSPLHFFQMFSLIFYNSNLSFLNFSCTNFSFSLLGSFLKVSSILF